MALLSEKQQRDLLIFAGLADFLVGGKLTAAAKKAVVGAIKLATPVAKPVARGTGALALRGGAALAPVALPLFGKLFNETYDIDLLKGWNLVGYPTLNDNSTLAEALVGVPYDMVQSYNQSEQYNLANYLDGDTMLPGLGYWIHVSADCVWTVSP